MKSNQLIQMFQEAQPTEQQRFWGRTRGGNLGVKSKTVTKAYQKALVRTSACLIWFSWNYDVGNY